MNEYLVGFPGRPPESLESETAGWIGPGIGSSKTAAYYALIHRAARKIPNL